jgi:hypothetical protein
MTVKDDLHQLVDQLDEDTARQALAYLQTLTSPRMARPVTVHPVEDVEDVDDLEMAELPPAQAVVEIQEPED